MQQIGKLSGVNAYKKANGDLVIIIEGNEIVLGTVIP